MLEPITFVAGIPRMHRGCTKNSRMPILRAKASPGIIGREELATRRGRSLDTGLQRRRKMLPMEHLKPIWEIAPYQIAIISRDGDPRERKFAHVNSAFTAATGHRSSEVVGRPVSCYGPKTVLAALQEQKTAVSQGKPCATAFVHYRKERSEYVASRSRERCSLCSRPSASERSLVQLGEPIPTPLCNRRRPKSGRVCHGS